MAGQETKKKYSYIRKPYAKNGWYGFAASFLSLLLAAATIAAAVLQNGTLALVFGALGFSSASLALIGLWFSAAGLRETERNKLFAAIGAGIGGLLLLAWVLIFMAGVLA